MSVFTNLLNAAKAAGYPPTDVSYSDMRAVLAYEIQQILGAIQATGPSGGKVATFSHDNIAVSGLANEVVRLSTVSPLKVIRCFVVAAESNDNPIGITPSPIGSGWQLNTVKPGQTYELSAFGNIIDLAQYYITSDANFQFDAFYWLPPA